MKVAFFFDTVLLKDEIGDFLGMTLTYDFFKNRYLKMFDEMIVSTRVKKKEDEKGNVSGYRKLNGKNVEVIPITYYNDFPDVIKNYKKINNQIEDVVKKVDKVIIRMPSVIGIFACKAAKKYGKNYLIEMVACPWDGYLNHIRVGGKVLAPIMWYYTRKTVKNAPNVLYVTDTFLQKRYPTRGNQIACSDVVLDIGNDSIMEKRINKIEKLNDKNLIKLGTVASVGLKYKGQEYVMEAMAKLKKKNLNFKYYLAGGGNSERLQNIAKKLGIENEVIFLGSLPHEKVFEMLDDIDIYVQPSLTEGLPRALLEAMSRACPTVGSNAGGISELVDKKYIFKKKNVAQLIEILNNVNKESLKEQAIRNIKKSKEFDSCILEEKRTQFYKSI